jgi:hypothetical protein
MLQPQWIGLCTKRSLPPVGAARLHCPSAKHEYFIQVALVSPEVIISCAKLSSVKSIHTKGSAVGRAAAWLTMFLLGKSRLG